MFWKRAERAGGRRWRGGAIATSLTVYYTLAALVLLAGASTRFYFGLESSMEQTHWDYLQQKVQVIPALLRRGAAEGTGINPAVLDEAETSGSFPTRFFLRVFDGSGNVLVETPDMTASLPRDMFPPSGPEGNMTRARRCLDGRCFLLASETVVRAGPRRARWQIQAALDVSSERQLLDIYLSETARVLVIGVLLASLIGAWIAHRGLRPIANITRATERIHVERLHERIQTGEWPRELVALADAFDSMLERLQDSFERLSQFSADLAHELRTPINNLMGEAQVALSRTRTAGEYVEILGSALEEYERLSRMIESMLFLASADHASLGSAQRAQLDARAQMSAVVDFYQALADEREISLRAEGQGTVLADASLLRRALSNLVSNAIEYTPRGGRVTIRVRNEADGACAFSVADTGIGIAPEHLSKLGNRFYRVDPSRSSAHSGSGLGLAIARSIMSLHGGSLALESSPGQGTTVTLHFPPDEPRGPDTGRRERAA
jgi:two-component system heavy metal sensor histidine kinase CusS